MSQLPEYIDDSPLPDQLVEALRPHASRKWCARLDPCWGHEQLTLTPHPAD